MANQSIRAGNRSEHRQENRSRVLAVALQAVFIVFNGIQLFRGQVGSSVIAVAIAVDILCFVFRPHEKRAFGRARGHVQRVSAMSGAAKIKIIGAPMAGTLGSW